MANFARIIENVAVDVSTAPAEHFHPSIAVDFVEVPDNVRPQWRLIDGDWQEPDLAPELPPAPEAPSDMRVTQLAFLQRFTLAERMSIRAARTTDPVVDDFMDLVDKATFIDLARDDTEAGVGYLVQIGKVTAERAESILTAPVQAVERPQGV